MASSPPLSTQGILKTWWPLALSWFMLTVEQPILAAVVARSVDAKVQLAAWGLAFSLILVLSAPSISMLAASTALSRDRESYRRGRGYMLWLCVGLTSAHFLLAYTPLFDLVVLQLIAPPPEIVEPVRTGVRILLPFIPSLAIRRFQYGVLIRCDQTRPLSVGTLLRLVLEVALALGLYWLARWDGITVATTAITAGVMFEAVYATMRVRPVLRNNLLTFLPGERPLTVHRFMRLYLPLVLTTLMQIMLQPLVSASLSRMPDSLGSLALWPVLYGVLIMTNSAAIAYVEAVIVLLDRPGSLRGVAPVHLATGTVAVRRFRWSLAVTPIGADSCFFALHGAAIGTDSCRRKLRPMADDSAAGVDRPCPVGSRVRSSTASARAAITEAVLLSVDNHRRAAGIGESVGRAALPDG